MTVLNSHATRFSEKKINKAGSDVRKSAQTLKGLLQELRKAVLEQQKNDKGWINLELKDKRDGGKYLQVQGNYQGKKQSGPVTTIAQEEDDMPF